MHADLATFSPLQSRARPASISTFHALALRSFFATVVESRPPVRRHMKGRTPDAQYHLEEDVDLRPALDGQIVCSRLGDAHQFAVASSPRQKADSLSRERKRRRRAENPNRKPRDPERAQGPRAEGDKGTMNQQTLRIPGTLRHTSDEQTDVALQDQAREHAERHPGVRFLADVLRALHAPGVSQRNAKTFYSVFTPREVMDALAQRPDLRVKVVKAITGSPAALLRRLSSEALASQIDLLAVEDLPETERAVRAEADRALAVHDLYLKYLEPLDLATYLPAQAIWTYESRDNWWKTEPTAGARALLAIELRSIRRHAILTDSEILDLLGDATLEGCLPLSVRTALRQAARRAAKEGRPFTDADLFAAGADGAGGRDLIDEMVESVPLPQLREVIFQVGRMLGLSALDDSEEPTTVSASNVAADAAVVPMPIGAQRVGPRAMSVGPTPPPPSRPRASNDRGATPPPKVIPPAPPAKGSRGTSIPVDAKGPPQPDDALDILEEISGRL